MSHRHVERTYVGFIYLFITTTGSATRREKGRFSTDQACIQHLHSPALHWQLLIGISTSSTIKTSGYILFAGTATVATAVVGVHKDDRGLLITKGMVRTCHAMCGEHKRREGVRTIVKKGERGEV